MSMPGYTLSEYLASGQRSPFDSWLVGLRDIRARARISARLDRVRLGNLGDFAAVGGGVYELRVDHGPGYRVYFAFSGGNEILLLTGGIKRSQVRDIKAARRYWLEYRNRNDED